MIGGKRLFGRSDVVDGAGHVATQFVHVWWFPIVPMASFFLRDGDRDRCAPIDLNWKSVITVWLRALCIWGCLGMAGYALTSGALIEEFLLVVFRDQPANYLWFLMVGFGLGVCYLIVGKLARRTSKRKRAEMLARFSLDVG